MEQWSIYCFSPNPALTSYFPNCHCRLEWSQCFCDFYQSASNFKHLKWNSVCYILLSDRNWCPEEGCLWHPLAWGPSSQQSRDMSLRCMERKPSFWEAGGKAGLLCCGRRFGHTVACSNAENWKGSWNRLKRLPGTGLKRQILLVAVIDEL